MPEECFQNAEFRVYRTWPVTDAKLANKDHKHELILRGKIPFEWGDWREEFLHRVGSGGYHCYLNEVGVPGSIMESYFTLQDWERFPPKVDLATLIQGEPKNQDYIQWLQRQGVRLPWEEMETPFDEDQQEEDEMKAVTDLVDKVLVSAEKRAEEAEKRAAEAQSRQPENTAETEGIKLVAHASHVALDTMAKYVGPQQDPMANLEKLGAFMDSRSSGNAQALEMMKMLMDSQNAAQERERASQREHFAFMEKVLSEKKEAAAVAVAAPPVVPAKTMLDQLRELHEMNELLGLGKRPRGSSENGGGGGGGGVLAEAVKLAGENPEVVKAVSQPLTALIQGGVSLLQGWLNKGNAAAGNGAGSPAQALGKVNAPAPQAVAPGPDPMEEQNRQRAAFVGKIGRPLLIHLSDPNKNGLNGYSWAFYILSDGVVEGGPTPEGRGFYEQLKKMGMQTLIGALASDKALYEKIAVFGEKFPAFWMEFENYDKWAEEQQGGGEKE